jgi:hypothetical protein
MIDDDHDSHAWFLLLSDANYTEWAMWMEAELIEKGLWEQVFVELDVNGKTIQEIESEHVRRHLSISLSPLFSPTLPLFICTSPTPLYHLH